MEAKGKKYTESRRKALKAVAFATPGAAVATNEWKKPILDTVLLPVHAATSMSLVCEIQFVEDDPAENFSFTEGTSIVVASEDESIADVDDGGNFNPRVTVSPSSAVDDVTLTVSSTNDAPLEMTPGTNPISTDTSDGEALFSSAVTGFNSDEDGSSFDSEDESLSMTFTFSAPGFDDCVIVIDKPVEV